MARRAGKPTVAKVKRPQGVISVHEVEDWAKAMDGLSPATDDDGHTAKELVAALGLCKWSVLRYLDRLLKAGECVRGTSRRRGVDGVLRRTPVYRLLGKARIKRKK